MPRRPGEPFNNPPRQTEQKVDQSQSIEGLNRGLAIDLYRQMLRGDLSIKPTFLGVHRSSRTGDEFGVTIYKLEVTRNSSAPYIGFSDSSGARFVFPNPGVGFVDTMRELFPNTKQHSDSIEPRVTQKADNLWVVVS